MYGMKKVVVASGSAESGDVYGAGRLISEVIQVFWARLRGVPLRW